MSKQFLVPTLKPSDVVILDNLGSHKETAVRKAIRDVGALLVFLPKYSPISIRSSRSSRSSKPCCERPELELTKPSPTLAAKSLIRSMMGERRVMQEALFYGFSLERHVPDGDLLRKIDRFVDLSDVRAHLEPYYSEVGRPSIDPELMIRMLIVGYCFGVRSERRLCEEVHLNLAYRWFCRLGLDGEVPDHSTFSKNRHGRFRESDLLRKLFETAVARCMKEGIVGARPLQSTPA
jgi:transposase